MQDRPAKPTAGSRFLEIVLSDIGRGARQDLASHLHVDLGVVSRWANGRRKPSTPMRARLQKEIGIDWELWDAPPGSLQATEPELAFARAAIQGMKQRKDAPESASTFPGGADRVAS